MTGYEKRGADRYALGQTLSEIIGSGDPAARRGEVVMQMVIANAILHLAEVIDARGEERLVRQRELDQIDRIRRGAL